MKRSVIGPVSYADQATRIALRFIRATTLSREMDPGFRRDDEERPYLPPHIADNILSPQ